MYSIIYNTDTKLFSVSTRMFAQHGKKNKGNGGGKQFIVADSDKQKFEDAKRQHSYEWQNAKSFDQKIAFLKKYGIQHTIKENNNGGGNGGGDKGDKESSNSWTKNSPKIYAYKKLLIKNLEELKRDHRVIEYKEIGDNYAVETPNDIWLNIYVTADGTYIITRLEMDNSGYATTSRRFNAIVAGPKDLREIISNVRRLEEPGILKKLLLRGVGSITGTDIVGPLRFKLW